MDTQLLENKKWKYEPFEGERTAVLLGGFLKHNHITPFISIDTLIHQNINIRNHKNTNYL